MEQSQNDVTLVGRVAAAAEQRELPSGDVLTSWRVVVDRPPATRTLPEGVRPTTVDTIDCVAWLAAVQRTAAGLRPGEVVTVRGSLRRRFWRGSGGPASRCEVEVSTLRRVRCRA